jgi:thiol-disulfide isomerase/thioredoxin
LARKLGVALVVVGALALILWAGWSNYHRRQMAARDQNAQQLVLTPDGGASASSASSAMPPSPLEGKQAPAFTLSDTSGKRVSLADYKGKAVLVNFWATWCAPCKVEIPWFAEFYKQYGSQGFEILGVDSDDLETDDAKKLAAQKQDIQTAATKLGINYPVLLDGESLAKDFGGIDVYPMSFYVDRSGKVVEVVAGLAPKDEIEANIKKALASGKA